MSPVVVPVSPVAGFCVPGAGVGVGDVVPGKSKLNPSDPIEGVGMVSHIADAEDAKIPSSITHKVNVNMLFVSLVRLILVCPFI